MNSRSKSFADESSTNILVCASLRTDVPRLYNIILYNHGHIIVTMVYAQCNDKKFEGAIFTCLTAKTTKIFKPLEINGTHTSEYV